MLHEALDRRQARVVVIAERLGDLPLDIEGQALLRLAGQEVHVAAHGPEEVVGLAEQAVFSARENASETRSADSRTR